MAGEAREERVDVGAAGGAGGGSASDGPRSGGGGFFNEDLSDVVRLYGEFANVDLLAEVSGVVGSSHGSNLDAMLERVGRQSGFDAVAHELGRLPPGELEPAGLGGASGRAKASALRRAIADSRAEEGGGESRIRRVLRWGKYFWGSLKNILGIFFPHLKNLMDAIDELLDYADNALADLEGGAVLTW